MPKRKLSSIQEPAPGALPRQSLPRIASMSSPQQRRRRGGPMRRGFPTQTPAQVALGFIPGQWEPVYVPDIPSDGARTALVGMVMRIAQQPLETLRALCHATVQLYRDYTQGRRVRAEPVNRPDGARKRRFIDQGPNQDSDLPVENRPIRSSIDDFLSVKPLELEFEGDRSFTSPPAESEASELEARELWEKCAFRTLYPGTQPKEHHIPRYDIYLSEGSSDESSDDGSQHLFGDVPMEDSFDSEASDTTVDTAELAPATHIHAERAVEPTPELATGRATEHEAQLTAEPATRILTGVATASEDTDRNDQAHSAPGVDSQLSVGEVTFTPTPLSPFSEGMPTPLLTSTPRFIPPTGVPKHKRVAELAPKLSPVAHAKQRPSPLRTLLTPVAKGKPSKSQHQLEKKAVAAVIKNATDRTRQEDTHKKSTGSAIAAELLNVPQIFPTMWTEEMSTLDDAPPLKETGFAEKAHIRTFLRDGLATEKVESFLEDVHFDVTVLSGEGVEEEREILSSPMYQKISPPVVVEELSPSPPPEPLLPELSIEQLKCLVEASKKTNGGRIHMDLAKGINTHDLKTLLPHEFNGNPIAWLNDNIVNEYLSLLVEHEKKKAGYQHKPGGPAPPVHAFPSQWSGKPDKDLVDLLLAWLEQELGDAFVKSEWTYDQHQRSMQQLNASDCGVFTCLNAVALLRSEDPSLVQITDGMHEARRHIAATLLSGHVNGEL
ncbi:uncharacterized protein EI97DRAFT_503399 [Westerdykella ornata]|uniref:Ubiquitin-like protease family profile domain-containing protein n=1 Tax=Westerdykella ornata TaxID=318751 RepID=A0A6A6JBF7_WESOR|nr:uncharacterized protein EI97DRAFT_503399 [Westerdykella ornata]KAF2273534.1 hypothetical protein EI97DRAFT_503399 [Westerdykella ornata]